MRREVHEASTTDTLTLDLTCLLIVRGLLTQLTRGDFLPRDAASVYEPQNPTQGRSQRHRPYEHTQCLTTQAYGSSRLLYPVTGSNNSSGEVKPSDSAWNRCSSANEENGTSSDKESVSSAHAKSTLPSTTVRLDYSVQRTKHARIRNRPPAQAAPCPAVSYYFQCRQFRLEKAKGPSRPPTFSSEGSANGSSAAACGCGGSGSTVRCRCADARQCARAQCRRNR